MLHILVQEQHPRLRGSGGSPDFDRPPPRTPAAPFPPTRELQSNTAASATQTEKQTTPTTFSRPSLTPACSADQFPDIVYGSHSQAGPDAQELQPTTALTLKKEGKKERKGTCDFGLC